MNLKHRRYRGEIRRLPPAPSFVRTLFWLTLALPMMLVAKWYADIVWQLAVAVRSDIQCFNGEKPLVEQATAAAASLSSAADRLARLVSRFRTLDHPQALSARAA